MKQILLVFISVILLTSVVHAQNEEEIEEGKTYTQNTFPNSRTVNLHTVNTNAKKSLGFRINHRFGPFEDGFMNLFGLDGPASIFIGFDYGVTDAFTIGFGRNSHNKLWEFFGKYNVLRQTTDNSMPLTLGIYAKANLTQLKDEAAVVNGFDRYDNFSHRLSYIAQVMIARKFSERVSFQLTPSFIHFNLVEGEDFSNNVISLSGSGRVKITKTIGITAEYSYVLNKHVPESVEDNYYNSLGIGMDIETGGHTFQLHFINTFTTNDLEGIAYTRNDWLSWQVRLGFNISREFWF